MTDTDLQALRGLFDQPVVDPVGTAATLIDVAVSLLCDALGVEAAAERLDLAARTLRLEARP